MKINYIKSCVDEIVKGKKPQAICVTAIGDNFSKIFNTISLPFFKSYCERYGLGLLVLKDFVFPKNKLKPPFDTRPNLQRLLFPKIILENFPNYKYICDIDADCIPGPVARDIFAYAYSKNTNKKDIFLIPPTPSNFNRLDIGKRLSLLRKTYIDPSFPLDTLISASDYGEKKIFDLKFKGPIAVIGTCLGSTRLLAKCFDLVIKKISKHFGIYLQHYTNAIFRKEGNVRWLPYEFQAIWSNEIALYYPFLFTKGVDKNILSSCVLSSLLRVDMLHFAGSWPENDVFSNGTFLKNKNLIKDYYSEISDHLMKKIYPKSYGKLIFKK